MDDGRLIGTTRAGTPVRGPQGRQHNLALVLRLLHAGGPTTRAKLARGTGLTRPTVSDLIAELIDLGYVVELGQEQLPRPGKPATVVDLNRHGRTVLALDLTAHEVVRAAVLDLDGAVVAGAAHHIDPNDQSVDVTVVLDLAREALAKATTPVIGIGVGSPGLVTDDGVVTTAANLGWSGVPLGDLLTQEFGLPVRVVNDADAAVHAEHVLGEGADDLMLVRIGRGVGAGLIVNGQLLRGAHGAAGEIGHVTVGTDGGRTCRCGRVGCLETWVSAPRLEATLADLHGAAAIDALTVAGERLGIALAPIVAALDLQEVVLNGPDHLVSGALIDATERTLHERVLTRSTRDLVVRLALDGDDIVLRGAAARIVTEIFDLIAST
jgi:predicted NBD/HSP70 family sugar kinase